MTMHNDIQPAYFTAARGLKMQRDAKGVLLVTISDGKGSPIQSDRAALQGLLRLKRIARGSQFS